MQKKPHRKKDKTKEAEKDKDPFKAPSIFGDIITLDNVSVNKEHRSRHNDSTMCVLLDRYTGWIGAYPAPARSTPMIVNTLQDFVGRKEFCSLLYFDGAPEYIAAARQLQIRYDTRDANRPASNGVAERVVRTQLEGTRSVLFASGLQHCYWAEAAKCYAFTKT